MAFASAVVWAEVALMSPPVVGVTSLFFVTGVLVGSIVDLGFTVVVV